MFSQISIFVYLYGYDYYPLSTCIASFCQICKDLFFYLQNIGCTHICTGQEQFCVTFCHGYKCQNQLGKSSYTYSLHAAFFWKELMHREFLVLARNNRYGYNFCFQLLKFVSLRCTICMSLLWSRLVYFCVLVLKAKLSFECHSTHTIQTDNKTE